MSRVRYIRNNQNGAVFLADSDALESFRQKKSVSDELDRLKSEINMLKAEVAQLKILLNTAPRE